MALKDRLQSQTKEKLLEARSFFEIDIPASARKAELIGAIGKHLLERTEDVLRMLPEYELRLLQGLSHLPKGHTYTFASPPTPYFLELFGMMNSSYNKDSVEISLSIDDDFRESVAQHIDSVIIDFELNGGFRAEMVFWGLLTTYGVVDISFLTGFIDKNYTEEYATNFYKRLVTFAPLRFFKHDGNLVHPALGNPEEFIEDRRRKGFENLKELPLEAIENAGMTTPYFASDMKTPHGQALLEALRSAGFDEDFLPHVVSNIWMQNQFNSGAKNSNQLLKIILENGRFNSQKQAEACMRAIMEYSNKIPKWFLGGRSSEEVGEMGFRAMRMDANMNAMAEKLAGIYANASRFPKVGRNAPCPCGSGLKYKNCHGKNQS